MTNFIFKSQKDLQKISQQLLTILDNQRFARNDLAILNGKITKIFNALALQKTVDEYYERDESVPRSNEDQEPD